MNTLYIFKKIGSMVDNRLPAGRIGDGFSKSHLEYMQKKVKEEFSDQLIGLENELEIAKAKAGNSDEVLELIENYERYIKLLTKLNRWLGWFQAVLVVFKIISFEETERSSD